MDSWSPKQLKCMQLGGNHSLSEFLSSYDLMSEPMDVRYQTKAAEYYRKKLRAFWNEEEFNEEKPDYEEGRLPIEYKVRSQEEIKNVIGSGQPAASSGDGVDKAKELFNEFWSGTKKVAQTGYNYTSNGVKKIGTKMEESGTTDKIKSGAKTVGTKTVEIGGIAYSKTKEGITKIANNEKVKEYSSKAYSGAKEVGTSVWGFFSKAVDQIKNQGNRAPAEDNVQLDAPDGGQFDQPAPPAPAPAPAPAPSVPVQEPVPTASPSADS